MRILRTLLILLVMLGIAAGGGAYYYMYWAVEPLPHFRTVEVARGNLQPTINATGTLEPEELVDVGAQVAGRIKSFGIDPGDPEQKKTIDYRSIVPEGFVLALIDDTMYKAQHAQAKASLERAKADLLQLKAKLAQTKRDWERAESLRPAKAIADTDYDLAVANYEAAKANVAVGEATIKQNEASLEMAEANLAYTVIKSPIQGEIIARRVSVGQTVVAGLNAPSLFLMAKDLRRMQVWVLVNEADIGRIYKDMPVRFTVDAFPGEVFRGKVVQIRYNAQMTQNIVIYTVVVATDNSDGKLLPYLTANIQFELQQHDDVLQVPNIALRWKPSKQQWVTLEARETTLHKSSDKKNGRGNSSDNAKLAKDAGERGRVWVVDDEGLVRPIDVKVGVNDGSMTEISGDDVKEGMEVVTGEVAASQDDGTTNPFAPKLFRGGAKK